MALGLCCQWLDDKNKNTLVTKSLLFSKRNFYSKSKYLETYRENVAALATSLPAILESGIRVFRMSSAIFPLWDVAGFDPLAIADIKDALADIGQVAVRSGLRITMHPGQFVSLSSQKEGVVAKSVKELEFAARIFSTMGLAASPYYAINIHGAAKDERKLISSLLSVDESIRSRLTLENCEYSWSVKKLIPVSATTGVPIVFDTHHHSLNPDGLSTEDAGEACRQTWGGIKPLTHISNSIPGCKNTIGALRAHSDFIYAIPPWQLELNNSDLIDVEVEAKMKNKSIFRMVELGAKL